MVKISSIDDMIKNRVGFGTWIIKEGATDPTRIVNLTDIVDESFTVKPFEIPTEKQLEKKIYKPTVGKNYTGLTHILETLNAEPGSNVLTALYGVRKNKKGEIVPKYPAYDGLIKNLKEGGLGTTNYQGFDLFFNKAKSNENIKNENRSISMFLPTVGGKGNIDTNISKFTDTLNSKQKQELGKRFKDLSNITPLKFDGNQKTNVRSTPMVHYYQSRYIASMLLEQAKQAVATKSDELKPISRMSGTEKQYISKAIDLSPDARTEVDQIFDMYPIGTTIRFRDKDRVAIGDEDLMTEGPHIDMGILQRQYGLYDTKKRNTFKELVAEIIKSLPVEEKHQKGTSRTYYSIDSKILESVLVWINDTEFNPPTTQSNLKMIEVLSEEQEEINFVSVALGSILEMPGWMLFEYSSDMGKSLIQLFSDDFEGEWGGRHQMYALAVNDYPEESESLEQALYDMEEFASMMITGTLAEVTTENITLDLDLSYIDSVLPETMRIRIDKDRLFSNDLDSSEIDAIKSIFLEGKNLPKVGLKSTIGTFEEKELDEDGDELYDSGIPISNISPWEKVNETYPEGSGVPYAEERGFQPIASRTVGIELAYPRIYELHEGRVDADYGLSRAFQALGDILMHLVGQNAQKVATLHKSASIYDRTIAGLLGTYEKPGPASYHAQLHHEMLKDMTRDALRQAEDQKGMVSLGASLVFEQYSTNPSKLMVMWMLANFKLIDMGGINKQGEPSFFTMPKTEFSKKGDEADLMNAMAMIIISYYRLAFYPLRMRGKSGDKKFQYKSKNWANLQKDANTDPPEPYAFAAVLRFLSQSKGKLQVDIPAWMPGLPKDFAGVDRQRTKKEVSEYISWAYGSNPTSKEHFCEIAAAYHAAKALSYYTPGRYAEMMQAFVEAVEAERGEGFLMSVLIAYNGMEKLPGQANAMESVVDKVETYQMIAGKLE